MSVPEQRIRHPRTGDLIINASSVYLSYASECGVSAVQEQNPHQSRVEPFYVVQHTLESRGLVESHTKRRKDRTAPNNNSTSTLLLPPMTSLCI